MNLLEYDYIIINSSAGKDSQAMTDVVCAMAVEQGVLGRVLMVHADLGRVEWKGTRELAEEHAKHYGIPFHVVRRELGDLLVQIEARGMFPDNLNRYCTSDQKRSQVYKLLTKLTADLHPLGHGNNRPVRFLNCMGFRKQESPARAKKDAFYFDKMASNGRRQVYQWLPIHEWKVEQVWERIKSSGVRWHYAYDLGMPRLSCCFCIFSPRAALLLAGKHNPELLAEYVRVEQKNGHTLRQNQSLTEIQTALANGEQPGRIQDWTM